MNQAKLKHTNMADDERKRLHIVDDKFTNYEGEDDVDEEADIENLYNYSSLDEDKKYEKYEEIYKNAPTKDVPRLSFEGAQLNYSSFKRGEYTCANIIGAELRYCSFEDAILDGANIIRSDLQGSNFKNANLEYAEILKTNMNFVSFENANLQGANIRNSDLRWSNLRGADLSNCIIRQTKLRGATYDQKTILPFDSQHAKVLGMVYVMEEERHAS